jgi:hypothetical protein
VPSNNGLSAYNYGNKDVQWSIKKKGKEREEERTKKERKME